MHPREASHIVPKLIDVIAVDIDADLIADYRS